MRILLISDIHANLPALVAVLESAPAYDHIWCLGDLVGYGPHPNQCIEKLRNLDALCLAGNHDWAALGKLDLGDFNPDARRAAEWTQRELSGANRDYLDGLEGRTGPEGQPFTLVHGSPRLPIWEYILTPQVAAANLEHFETTYCLFGHTHLPMSFLQLDGRRVAGRELVEGDPVRLGSGRQYLNPGSVGQPRDGDPRAAYAILDMEELTVMPCRVAYDIATTQADMTRAKLPPRLIARLIHGM